MGVNQLQEMPANDLTCTMLDSIARVAIVMTDLRQRNNPIVECNKPFLELTGYKRHEVIGRNCWFLAGPGTDPEQLRLANEAVEEERPVMVEFLSYRKDGTPFLNSIIVVPIYDDDGERTGILTAHLGPSRKKPKHAEILDGPNEAVKEVFATLRPRQLQVLRGIAAGKRYGQISSELGVCTRTVKMHRAAMLKSLGALTNAEGIKMAIKAGVPLD